MNTTRQRQSAQVWLSGPIPIGILFAVWLGLCMTVVPTHGQSGIASLDIATATGHRGERVEIPIQLSGLGGSPVGAAQVEVRFDGGVLAFEELVTAGSLSEGWLVEYNLQPSGQTQTLHIGLAGLQDAAADGILLSLAFQVPADVPFGSFSPLEILGAELEQDPLGELLALQTDDGLFRVGVPPVLWVNQGLVLDEGATAALTSAQLAVQDVDNPADELVYTLLGGPTSGALSGPQGALGPGNTFTQAEIDQNALNYVHNGSETASDAFLFSVTDGDGASLTGTFIIQVSPVNDIPTIAPLGALQMDAGQSLEVTVESSDPDGTASLSAANLPSFAGFVDRGDGTGTLRFFPGFNNEGFYDNIVITATDEDDPDLTASQTFSLAVILANEPPVAAAGDDQTIAYTTLTATSVVLDGTDSSDPEGDPLTYRWSVDAALVATGPTPTIALPLGTHTIILVVSDGVFDSPADELVVEIVDATAPELTLLGDNPLLIEVGTPYDEPGATASDAVDGDLTGSIVISGSVNTAAEGTYQLAYQVSDLSGNAAATQVRTVQVVATANSYALIAINSMEILPRATVHSGFVGVVDYGVRPLLGGRAELDLGTRAITAEGVRVSAPRVRVRNRAAVLGTLVYTEQVLSSRSVTIGQEIQVSENYWPLFAGIGLPEFEVGAPDNERVDVRSGQTATLDAGVYGTVRVRSQGTLLLTGGTYDMRRFDIDSQAQVLAAGPTVMRIEGRFDMGSQSYFGPENDGGDPADLFVYVNGQERRGNDDDDDDDGNGDDDGGDRVSRAVDVGERAAFSGNLYAPHGTIHLHSRAQALGSFIAYDLIVGSDAEVRARSGWQMPGVVFAPPPLSSIPPAAKPVATVEEADGDAVALDNYPNPFNPTTTLHYALPEGGPIELVIYSALGQKIKTLVDDVLPPGHYSIKWDGRDARGVNVASGVYLAQLRTLADQHVRKLILMR